jgi:hypothetical protein
LLLILQGERLAKRVSQFSKTNFLKRTIMARKSADVEEKPTKTNSKAFTTNLLDEYQAHLRTVEFYRIECKHLIKRLEEVPKYNTDKEILARVTQLASQFDIIRENMDLMSKDIAVMLKAPEKGNDKTAKINMKYRMQVHVMEKHFASFKLRLNKFISKNL